MRIVIFTENYWCGGMDVFIASLINYWPREKDEFVIVANYDHPGIEVINKRLHRPCRIISHRFFTAAGVARMGNHSLALRWLRRLVYEYGRYAVDMVQLLLLVRLFGRIDADRVIVVSGSYPGGNTCRLAALSGLFGRKWGKPLFVYHNDPTPARWSQAVPEYVLDFLLERSVCALVTVSRYTQGKLSCRPALKNSKKRKVIYNGIEPVKEPVNETVNGKSGSRQEQQTPLPPTGSPPASTPYEELGIEAATKIILMLATYEERKGHDFLFQAMKEVIQAVGNVHLVCAGFGYGHEQQRVAELVEKYSLSSYVTLLGFRNDAARLLRHADLLAVPSQRGESFGLTNVEAMACRVPVVATRTGGIPEVVQEGAGGFTTALEPGLFAQKMILLLLDGPMRKEMGQQGYSRYLQHFTAERMCRQYADLLAGKS